MKRFLFSGEITYLSKELGNERFEALVDPTNMDKLKKFCDELLKKNAIPTEMTIGGRTYDILGFLREKETSVVGDTMVERAREMDANLGADDGQYLLDHQDEIPAILRGKMYFVFTDWRHPDDSESVYYIYWHEHSQRWVRRWSWLGHGYWSGCVRVFRRKPVSTEVVPDK